MTAPISPISSVPPPDLHVAIRTLTTGGFILDRVDRKPGYALILMRRVDEFGALHRYCFALSESNAFGPEQVQAIQIPARQLNCRLVFVGKAKAEDPSVTWERFLGLFGGPVLATSPLEPNFAHELQELAFNRLPAGLQGEPEDLLEAYVRIAFEFIMGTRVIRYGKERLFEACPDGIILPVVDFTGLYDAKAYSDGYDVTLDSVRQFGSYVADFRTRYGAYLPRLNSFVVVSGAFKQGSAALEDRNRDFIAEWAVSLAFLKAENLASIITEIAAFPRARRSIRWNRVFASTVVDPALVRQELQRIKKDGIVT